MSYDNHCFTSSFMSCSFRYDICHVHFDTYGITVGIQPMPGFHSHGLHAPVHEENGSRQPRQAVLVSLVIQTLSLL